MTLLEEIQSSAIDANSDLATLLRKCKLLATRIRNQPLEDWLIWESNGYPADVQVPDYRIWPLEVKGHFTGPFGSGITNAPIPLSLIPEKYRKSYQRYQCRQSIASIEALLRLPDKGRVQVASGDLALILGEKVYSDQCCIQAWAEFGTGHLVELVNAVRNRILDFALALWKEAPEAGDSPNAPTTQLKDSQITQIFNTTVYGGAANLVGTSSASTIAFNIGSKDFPSLERVLQENGLQKENIKELQVALEAEPEPLSEERFGPKVSAWIARMMGKAAEGTWDISLGAAGNLLAQAIAKYYGL